MLRAAEEKKRERDRRTKGTFSDRSQGRVMSEWGDLAERKSLGGKNRSVPLTLTFPREASRRRGEAALSPIGGTFHKSVLRGGGGRESLGENLCAETPTKRGKRINLERGNSRGETG